MSFKKGGVVGEHKTCRPPRFPTMHRHFYLYYLSRRHAERLESTAEVQMIQTILHPPKNITDSNHVSVNYFFYHFHNAVTSANISETQRLLTHALNFEYVDENRQIDNNSFELTSHSKSVALTLCYLTLLSYPKTIGHPDLAPVLTPEICTEMFHALLLKNYRMYCLEIWDNATVALLLSKAETVSPAFVSFNDCTGMVYVLGTVDIFIMYLDKLRHRPLVFWSTHVFNEFWKNLTYALQSFPEDEVSWICYEYAQKYFKALGNKIFAQQNTSENALKFLKTFFNLVSHQCYTTEDPTRTRDYSSCFAESIRELMPGFLAWKQKNIDNHFEIPNEKYAYLTRIVHNMFYRDLANFIIEYI